MGVNIEFAHSYDRSSCVMWLNRAYKKILRDAGISSNDLLDHLKLTTRMIIDHEHIKIVEPTLNPDYALGISLERYSYISWIVIESELSAIIETLAAVEQRYAPVRAFG